MNKKERETKQRKLGGKAFVQTYGFNKQRWVGLYHLSACDWPSLFLRCFELSNKVRVYGFGL